MTSEFEISLSDVSLTDIGGGPHLEKNHLTSKDDLLLGCVERRPLTLVLNQQLLPALSNLRLFFVFVLSCKTVVHLCVSGEFYRNDHTSIIDDVVKICKGKNRRWRILCVNERV